MQGRLEWNEGTLHFILETHRKPEKKQTEKKANLAGFDVMVWIDWSIREDRCEFAGVWQ